MLSQDSKRAKFNEHAAKHANVVEAEQKGKDNASDSTAAATATAPAAQRAAPKEKKEPTKPNVPPEVHRISAGQDSITVQVKLPTARGARVDMVEVEAWAEGVPSSTLKYFQGPLIALSKPCASQQVRVCDEDDDFVTCTISGLELSYPTGYIVKARAHNANGFGNRSQLTCVRPDAPWRPSALAASGEELRSVCDAWGKKPDDKSRAALLRCVLGQHTIPQLHALCSDIAERSGGAKPDVIERLVARSVRPIGRRKAGSSSHDEDTAGATADPGATMETESAESAAPGLQQIKDGLQALENKGYSELSNTQVVELRELCIERRNISIEHCNDDGAGIVKELLEWKAQMKKELLYLIRDEVAALEESSDETQCLKAKQDLDDAVEEAEKAQVEAEMAVNETESAQVHAESCSTEQNLTGGSGSTEGALTGVRAKIVLSLINLNGTASRSNIIDDIGGAYTGSYIGTSLRRELNADNPFWTYDEAWSRLGSADWRRMARRIESPMCSLPRSWKRDTSGQSS